VTVGLGEGMHSLSAFYLLLRCLRIMQAQKSKMVKSLIYVPQL